MSTNNEYKIKSVTVSTNGRNKLFFDVDWQGDANLDYFELRIYEDGQDNCLEAYAYPTNQQRVIVDDYSFITNWESKKVNKQIVHVELGIYEYDDDGKLISKEVLATYEPIELNIYHEFHFIRKNVLELR